MDQILIIRDCCSVKLDGLFIRNRPKYILYVLSFDRFRNKMDRIAACGCIPHGLHRLLCQNLVYDLFFFINRHLLHLRNRISLNVKQDFPLLITLINRLTADCSMIQGVFL